MKKTTQFFNSELASSIVKHLSKDELWEVIKAYINYLDTRQYPEDLPKTIDIALLIFIQNSGFRKKEQ